MGCSGLTEVTISDSVKTISSGAFDECSGLPAENYIKYVGTYAVEVTNNKQSTYTIKPGTTFLSDGLFSYCTSLTSIVIPDSVKTIGNGVFHTCSGLTEVTIGSGVTTMGYDVFKNCSGLSEITCHAVIAPSIDSDTFRNIKQNGTLYVPAGSDYSSWMSTSSDYLGYYNWTIQNI
jgi:hypothetical protein